MQPFPTECPEFQVEIQVQDPEEVAAVADRFRIGQKNTSLTNELRASIEVVRKTLLDWKGEEPIFGEKVSVNDENKKRFAMVYVEPAPGERVTLFAWTVRVAEDKEAVELKNS